MDDWMIRVVQLHDETCLPPLVISTSVTRSPQAAILKLIAKLIDLIVYHIIASSSS